MRWAVEEDDSRKPPPPHLPLSPPVGQRQLQEGHDGLEMRLKMKKEVVQVRCRGEKGWRRVGEVVLRLGLSWGQKLFWLGHEREGHPTASQPGIKFTLLVSSIRRPV